jgi:hypothetical protein
MRAESQAGSTQTHTDLEAASDSLAMPTCELKGDPAEVSLIVSVGGGLRADRTE